MAVEESKRDKRFISGENIVLKSVRVKWAHLHSPDTKYNPMYSVDVMLDADDSKELKGLGVNVRDSEDGPWIKVLTYVTTKAGKKNRQPRVVGLDPKVPFTEEIGNGSICNILMWSKYVKVDGEWKLPTYLEAVQVIEHVPYTAGESSGFDDLSDNKSTDVPF